MSTDFRLRKERRKFEQKVKKRWTKWFKTLSLKEKDAVIEHLRDLLASGEENAVDAMENVMGKTQSN